MNDEQIKQALELLEDWVQCSNSCNDMQASLSVETRAFLDGGPEKTISATHGPVIQALLAVAAAAYVVLDNTDSEYLTWGRADFNKLSEAMDALEAIPDWKTFPAVPAPVVKLPEIFSVGRMVAYNADHVHDALKDAGVEYVMAYD